MVRTPGIQELNVIDQAIVVGVDGSAGSLVALSIAFEEARLRQAPLRVVMAWQLAWSEIARETPSLVKQVEDHAAELLERTLASVDPDRGGCRSVDARWYTVPPRQCSSKKREHATLLVVGTRGTGGVTGTLVGSVAHAAIHHAALRGSRGTSNSVRVRRRAGVVAAAHSD